MIPLICKNCIHFNPEKILGYGYSASEQRYGKIIPCDVSFQWLHDIKLCSFFESVQFCFEEVFLND